MKERLQVVDENDEPIGVATREEAWANDLILRHAYIVLRDRDGKFLLQQRSSKKKSNPLKWTWAATGHVDEGETYEAAASRELFEEIGVKTTLAPVGKMRTIHQNKNGTLDYFIYVFTGHIDLDTPLSLDPEEVETTRWFTPSELRDLIASGPENTTYNTRTTYSEFFS